MTVRCGIIAASPDRGVRPDVQQLTIDIEENVLLAYEEYARQRGLSLNEVIQRVLAEGISPARTDWLEECFRLMDEAGVGSGGRRWRRADLYDG